MSVTLGSKVAKCDSLECGTMPNRSSLSMHLFQLTVQLHGNKNSCRYWCWVFNHVPDPRRQTAGPRCGCCPLVGQPDRTVPGQVTIDPLASHG